MRDSTDRDHANLSRDEILEVEAEERRRLIGAFLIGSEASEAKPRPGTLMAQLVGIALGLAVAVAIGMVGLVQHETRSSGSHSGTGAPTPAATPGLLVTAAPSPVPVVAGLQPSTPAGAPTIRPSIVPSRRPP